MTTATQLEPFSGDLIDIGANLSHESFQHDMDSVLEDARVAGLKKIILTGTCIDSTQKALLLTERFPDFLHCTAGIHPHDAKDFNAEALSKLKHLITLDAVKAVGETGLDFNRDFSPRPQQEVAFTEQLALAAEAKMPVFLHQRDAHERFLPILKQFRDAIPRGVVHCFTGTKEELHAYLDLDMYIGITGWVCDERRGHDLHPLLQDIPENRLLIETDSPYLLPRSIRPKPKSRRNVPANLRYVLETVANCLNKNTNLVAKHTYQNARDFFAI